MFNDLLFLLSGVLLIETDGGRWAGGMERWALTELSA